MASMRILLCTCSGGRAADFQDERYGKGKRACNPRPNKTGGLEYICTVCGSLKTGKSTATAKPASKKGKKG